MVSHEAYGNNLYKWGPWDFELGSSLGRGKFGHVHIAREKKTGFLVAIKTLFKSQIIKYECELQVLREIEIQSHLSHPNILRMLTWFHDQSRIYIVLEYAAGGELHKHLLRSPNRRFPQPTAAKYIYQVADAVEFCHQHHVIHRDIKPQNILVDYLGDLKLADFGWSVHAPSERRRTICGTIDYFPPEMVRGEVYDTTVDQWCIGVLLYEFLVGSPPFASVEQRKTFDKIISLDIKYPHYLSNGAKDLISKLLRPIGKERISLIEVKNHYWVQSFYGAGVAGPSSSGPSSSGPSSSGPSTSGPSTSGASTSGASNWGPSTWGPSTSGPSTSGPSTSYF